LFIDSKIKTRVNFTKQTTTSNTTSNNQYSYIECTSKKDTCFKESIETRRISTHGYESVVKTARSINNDSIKKSKATNDIKPSQAFYNQQVKAFRQLAAIVIGFTICFLPYFVLFLIIALCDDCVNEYFFKLTIWLGYMNSTLNPFLYAFSNRGHIKTLCKKKLTTSNYLVSRNLSLPSVIKTDTTLINKTLVSHYC
jgi:hypothetical protein